MKFEELKKSLKQKVYDQYVLTGTDSFLLSWAYKIIKETYNIEFEELNFIPFIYEQIDFNDVVKALETLPAFTDKKLIYIDLTNNVKISNLNKFENYLKTPNNLSKIIIKLGDNLNLFNFNLENFVEVDCNKISKDIALKFIDNEFFKNNKTIEVEAKDLLYEYCLGDMTKINNEIIKLTNYSYKSNILVEDVNDVVNKSLEYKVYELTEALALKKGKKVYEIIFDMKQKKDGVKGIVGLIYNHFRRLLEIALNENKSDSSIAQMLGVKDYAVIKSKKQIKLFKKKQLKDIVDFTLDLDYKLKNSDIDINNAVQFLIAYILSI